MLLSGKSYRCMVLFFKIKFSASFEVSSFQRCKFQFFFPLFLITCTWSWWGRESIKKTIRQTYSSNQRSGLQSKIKKKKKIVKTVKQFGCTKQFCILQLPVSYCVSLIMITITRHIFINIFQMELFSAVKFAMGYEKILAFL